MCTARAWLAGGPRTEAESEPGRSTEASLPSAWTRRLAHALERKGSKMSVSEGPGDG